MSDMKAIRERDNKDSVLPDFIPDGLRPHECDELYRLLKERKTDRHELLTMVDELEAHIKIIEGSEDLATKQAIKAESKLDAVRKWQPIEKPPNEAGMYLCYLTNSQHVLYGEPDKWFEPYEVTHWMPLPDPPEEEDK